MTNDQIAELAKQAGFSFEEEAHGRGDEPFTIERSSINELKRFVELVRNEALEEAAIKSWSCGMDWHMRRNTSDVREVGSSIAEELRSMKT